MVKFLQRSVGMMLLALSMAGCTTVNPVALAPSVELAELSALPAPDVNATRLIGPQEQLEISVFGSEPLSGKFLTDGQGYIAFPLIGDLYVGGKTPNQAAKMIADRLRGDYVKDPQVNVRPTEVQSLSISVGGEVSKPGTYPSSSSPTLMRAINNAGGLAEYAKSDDVLILRTVGGQKYIGVYNINAIARGNYDDPAVFSDDIITVGESIARRRLDAILQFIPLFSTSAILIERAVNK